MQQLWRGISEEITDGILLFENIPDIVESPLILPTQNLDTTLTQTFLNVPSITSSFDTNSKVYYLQLVSNTTFYIIEQPPKEFFWLGPHFNVPEESIRICTTITPPITVDVIQQHLLRHGITKDDIGSNILLDLICEEDQFTIAKISKVYNLTVKVCIYAQQNPRLDNEWELLPTLVETVSKGICLAKGVEFTKNMTLKKKWKTFLKNKFSL